MRIETERVAREDRHRQHARHETAVEFNHLAPYILYKFAFSRGLFFLGDSCELFVCARF